MKLALSTADTENLMAGLEVEFVKLAECVVSPGWQLALAPHDRASIHYNLMGTGHIIIGRTRPIPLTPHTLVIAPAGAQVDIEATRGDSHGPVGRTESRLFQSAPGELVRVVAGNSGPEILLICGYFHASYGNSVDVFGSLFAPIVETFAPRDRLDEILKSALAELVSQEVGAGVMSAVLLKHVLLTVVRRSLSDAQRWSERFSHLSDPKIARAFAAMVARPEAPHTVQSLADTAGLSRSNFVARFSAALGEAPMATLRRIRMRRARTLLEARSLPVERIAAAVGYSSRTSFYRAFRKVYGWNPTSCNIPSKSSES